MTDGQTRPTPQARSNLQERDIMAAQTWDYTRNAKSGRPQPTIKASGFNPSGVLLTSLTGPTSSVQAGMLITSVVTDLATHIYGGRIIGRKGSWNANYDYVIEPASSNTAAQCKIVARMASTGAKLAAGTDLSGENLIVEFIGH